MEPVADGLCAHPQATSAIVASPLGGRLAARIGAGRTMLIGLLIGAAGFLSLTLIDSHTPYIVVAILTFLAGFGMAFAMPAATSAAVNAAPKQYTGIAGGVINAARQTGSVFGVALLGAMITGGSFIAGFHMAVGIAGGVFLFAAVTVGRGNAL